MWNVWGRREVQARVWWGHLEERHHLEARGVDGMIILKWIFSGLGGRGLD